MPSGHPPNRSAVHPVHTAAIVTRGSAPHGTFSIPEDGLHISDNEEKSFLAKFQASARIRSENEISAKTSDIAAIPRNEMQQSLRFGNEQCDRNAMNGDVEEIQVQLVADKGEVNCFSDKIPAPVIENSFRQDTVPEEQPVQLPNPVPAVKKHFQDEKAERTGASTVEAFEERKGTDHLPLNGKSGQAEKTVRSAAERDNAIMAENRTSYPILRFCSGISLLDQHALDILVSYFLSSTFLVCVWFGPFAD